MVRILTVITTQFVPYGGLTTVAMNYYRRFDHRSFGMDFASTNEAPEELCRELAENGDTYHRLPARRHVLRYYRALKALCASYEFIHVHANSATASLELLAAKKAGVQRRIVHIHNTTCSHKVLHAALKPLFDRLYTDAIACSRAAGAWIFPEGGYLVLNNAIDLERYAFSPENRRQVRRALGIGEGRVVGNVGKIIKQKNHVFLLQAFSHLHKTDPSAMLLLVGDGFLRKEIERLAEEMGLSDKVLFTGMVDASEKYLSAMDCFLLPSLWEGLPLALLEAQDNGLPCLVSDKVTREVGVTPTVTFLPVEGTEKEWAEKTAELPLADREARSRDNAALLRKNGFDISINVRKLNELYMS